MQFICEDMLDGIEEIYTAVDEPEGSSGLLTRVPVERDDYRLNIIADADIESHDGDIMPAIIRFLEDVEYVMSTNRHIVSHSGYFVETGKDDPRFVASDEDFLSYRMTVGFETSGMGWTSSLNFIMSMAGVFRIHSGRLGMTGTFCMYTPDASNYWYNIENFAEFIVGAAKYAVGANASREIVHMNRSVTSLMRALCGVFPETSRSIRDIDMDDAVILAADKIRKNGVFIR